MHKQKENFLVGSYNMRRAEVQPNIGKSWKQGLRGYSDSVSLSLLCTVVPSKDEEPISYVTDTNRDWLPLLVPSPAAPGKVPTGPVGPIFGTIASQVTQESQGQ